MTTQHLEHRRVSATPTIRKDSHVWAWYAAAAALFFLVPFVGTDLLGLQPDLFYLGYFTVAVVFLASFMWRYADALTELWRVRLWPSLIVGALVGGLLVVGASRQDGVPHAEGWRFGFELVWRGLVYGTVDALTLYVFPAAVAFLVMRGDRRTKLRKVGFAGLALVLSMFVTATYHLGYPDFRDGTIRYPEIGAVAANVPTVLTGNPLGAVVTHVTMHVTTTVHQRDGGEQHMLPPSTTGDYPDHGRSDLAAGLAALWLVGTGVALTELVRRRRQS